MAIKRYFYIWLLRYRLWRLQKAYSAEEWKPTPALLQAINLITIPWLLSFYTPRKGRAITLVCGFTNAERVLMWLATITAKIEASAYLTNDDSKPILARAIYSLDEFLVNERGASIAPLVFHARFADAITALSRALDSVDQGRFSEYYHRRLGGLFADLFAIQEALLKAALAE